MSSKSFNILMISAVVGFFMKIIVRGMIGQEESDPSVWLRVAEAIAFVLLYGGAGTIISFTITEYFKDRKNRISKNSD